MAANHKPFNIIFCSQGSALKIFDHLLPPLHALLPLHQVGLFVADQAFYQRYRSGPNNFNDYPVQWLKEWDINHLANQTKIDLTKINHQEALYGQPNLWPSLMADRRIFLGPLTKYKQDYTPRLSYGQMLRRLQTSIEQIEQFIDKIQPHAIIGFNMVTLGEYLFYLIARHKNIPYWQIKNAKINNLITLVPDPLRLTNNPSHLPPPDKLTKNLAHEYLRRAQVKNSTYEGHVILKPPTLSSLLNPTLAAKLAVSLGFSLSKLISSSTDHQSAGLPAVWQFNIVKPIKTIHHHHWLSRHYLPRHLLPSTSYVFFPLHTEPEIALSIYGRYHQNQIEVIRNIAQSLPVTYSLVVKDHPRSLGLRKLQYYKKLLQIPNVKLVNPYLPSYDVIESAQAIITISSWVGFEAVMSKKPVITMGECAYNNLPDSMIAQNTSYQQLSADLDRILKNYHYDEAALLTHIATVISKSFPINMYSEVLAKPNRHSESVSSSNPHLWSDFARYIINTIGFST